MAYMWTDGEIVTAEKLNAYSAALEASASAAEASAGNASNSALDAEQSAGFAYDHMLSASQNADIAIDEARKSGEYADLALEHFNKAQTQAEAAGNSASLAAASALAAETAAKEAADSANKPIAIAETLPAGETELSILNEAITTSSVIDFYTNVFGVNPADIVIADGKLSLVFDSQEQDISVLVEIHQGVNFGD